MSLFPTGIRKDDDDFMTEVPSSYTKQEYEDNLIAKAIKVCGIDKVIKVCGIDKVRAIQDEQERTAESYDDA